jgi:hypothetical protein
MAMDRNLYGRVVSHMVAAVEASPSQSEPFPYLLIAGIFPDDVYRHALALWPSTDAFAKASLKHHTDEYGGSTRGRMNLIEASLEMLPSAARSVWTTLRAATGSPELKAAVFHKLGAGLVRRYGVPRTDAVAIDAYPRGTLYSEKQGYRIAPHPDTREKIVTMQFAFPEDDSMKHVGTEFYSRSLNPAHWFREPRGFVTREAMPFLPNHAYAFSVLNTISLKSWHGRSTIDAIPGVRNSLLHIWYAKPDETHPELESYFASVSPVRRAA